MTAWTTEKARALRALLVAAVGEGEFEFSLRIGDGERGEGSKYEFEFTVPNADTDEGRSFTTFSVSNATGYWGPHTSHWFQASVKRKASRVLEGDWNHVSAWRVFKDDPDSEQPLNEDATAEEVAKLFVEAWQAVNKEYPEEYAARAKEAAEKTRKKKARKPRDLSHSEFLNSKNASPVVEDGKIVALEFYENGDYDTPLVPSAEDLEWLGLDSDDLGCVEPHPEGADRGGYVPTLANGCYYSETSCEWEG